MKCPKCLKEDYGCECGFITDPLEQLLKDKFEADTGIASDSIKQYLPNPPLEEIDIDLDLLQHDSEDEVQELDFDEVAFNGDEPLYYDEEYDDDNPRD